MHLGNRGLDIMRAEWEAPTLRSVKNYKMLISPPPYCSRFLSSEITSAAPKLNADPSNTGKQIKEGMRGQAFDQWSSLSQKGKGIVIHTSITQKPTDEFLIKPK